MGALFGECVLNRESRTTLDGGGSQTPLILLLYSPSHIKRNLEVYPLR